MNTPDNITELEPGQVFVFGSNKYGLHDGGAAHFAFDHFGAEWGVGEGPSGRSYAIPTMGTFAEMERAVNDFLAYAFAHPLLVFLVTKIGTGIAPWSIEKVAPLFTVHPINVVLPIEFEEVIA